VRSPIHRDFHNRRAVAVIGLLSALGSGPLGAPVGAATLPRFRLVTSDVGLSLASAKRVTFADLDGDGYPELVLDAARLYRFDPGSNAFEEVVDAGLDRGHGGTPRAPDLALFVDLDGDGDLDAISGRSVDRERPVAIPETDEPVLDAQGCPVPARPDHGERSHVLLNDGSGRFQIVDRSGIERPETIAAVTAFDADRDGQLDLFVGNWYREYGVSYRAYSDRLYHGLGDGRFVDVTNAAGIATEDSEGKRASAKPTYGATHADIDGDGREDILVATYGRQWNVLWRQRTDGTFEDVAASWGFDGDAERDGTYWAIERTEEPPFRANGNTFDLAVSDFDNDGDLDLFTGEICHWWGGRSSDRSELLVNEIDHFERTRDRGIDRVHGDAWHWNEGDIHVGFLDFDNDGLDDLLIGSGDYPDRQELRLYRQNDDHTFLEVTRQVGLDWEGAGGISIADFDRDGDLDVAVGRSLFRLPRAKRDALGTAPGLWRNDGGNRNRWLQVELRGVRANRAGIGARVRVGVAGRVLTRELISGRGHMGHADELILHFGLASDRRVDWVEVRWPDVALSVERFGPFDADQRVELVQGQAQP